MLPPGPKSPLSKIVPTSNAFLADAVWTRDLVWTGEVKEKKVRGLEVGYLNRVYLGRKRMFKGHKWERTMARRMGRRRMLLRDMKHRIKFYKTVRRRFASFEGFL